MWVRELRAGLEGARGVQAGRSWCTVALEGLALPRWYPFMPKLRAFFSIRYLRPHESNYPFSCSARDHYPPTSRLAGIRRCAPISLVEAAYRQPRQYLSFDQPGPSPNRIRPSFASSQHSAMARRPPQAACRAWPVNKNNSDRVQSTDVSYKADLC